MGAPRASRSSSSGLAVANVLGTGVELNGDGRDPPHGLVATAAARRPISTTDSVVVENLKVGRRCGTANYSAGHYNPSLATQVGNLVIACFTLLLTVTPPPGPEPESGPHGSRSQARSHRHGDWKQ